MSTNNGKVAMTAYQAVIEAYDEDDHDYRVYDDSVLFTTREAAERAVSKLSPPPLGVEWHPQVREVPVYEGGQD